MSDINPKEIGAIPPQVGSTNRGYDNRITTEDAPELVVTLEKINTILLEYMTNVISPTIIENDEAKAVPVMYGAGERWASIRTYGGVRDEDNDKLLAPLIVLRRTGERRNALTNPSNKYLYMTHTTGWNARNAYDRFAIQNNIRPSAQMRHIMVPDYLDLTYDVILWTEYQQQMDTLIEQINVEADEYWGMRNDFKFRVSISEYQNTTELPAMEARMVRQMFTMKVSGYLIPERMVKNFKVASTNSKTYTVKKLVTMVETVSDIRNVDP